jgi:hypothetical protein
MSLDVQPPSAAQGLEKAEWHDPSILLATGYENAYLLRARAGIAFSALVDYP